MQINPGANLLLKARVGSKAFGLANEQSDDDYQGIFVVPTQMLLGLETKITESYSFKNPDTSYHEVGKFCRLALGCNPTVLDLLWVEDYIQHTELGNELVGLRSNFLSAPKVKGAYFGYANDQYSKLLKDKRQHKRAKNARHFLRLLEQGCQLYLTGAYSVRLKNPEAIRNYAEQIADGDLSVAQQALSNAETFFNLSSALPEKPNKEPIDEWVLKVRHELYQYGN